jgi:hypothetical protein
MTHAILTALPSINKLKKRSIYLSKIAISVRELEGGPAQFQSSYKASVKYKSSFDNIVTLAKDVRPVSINEYKVTKTLARPFRHGGLLVLLQEPLWNHP